ncbi:unnamed protein product [Acanthocheilonema viteae]|uniref:Transmembrane protein 208 n=1 Tax=Acanthocheilonema viteae TaxID=6277 RepID=A0A498SE44_ACAVI|nr:unnamed protein product [Acanthocheilonema viteae]
MNISGRSGKAATRGQKQIYEENRAVILHYSAAAILSSFGFLICCLLEVAAILTMRSMARCRRNEKGQVIDAGLDLNQPDAFGEYCKDVVILCSFIATVAIIWSTIFWLLLLIPAYVLYKLWKVIIAPWFFAEPPEQEEDKKIKKRERKLRKT